MINDPELLANSEQAWAPELVADCIAKYCQQKESLEGANHKIDMLVTYDSHGITFDANN